MSAGVRRDQREQFAEIDRAELPVDRHDAQREAEVTDAVDDEGLDGGRRRTVLGVPEADQKVGRQAHAFPAEEQLHEVGGGHQHQHGKGEQRQIGEEARARVVLGHIAPAIKVDQRRHGRNHDQHGAGQRIDADRPGRLEGVDIDEVQQLDREVGHAAPRVLDKGVPAAGAGDEQKPGRHGLGQDIADAAAEQAGDDRTDDRREDGGRDHSRHRRIHFAGEHIGEHVRA